MRKITTLTEGWRFLKAAIPVDTAMAYAAQGEAVTLPHTWNAVDGATTYRAYTKAANTWQAFDTVEGTETLFTDVTPGSSYTFTVRCIGTNGKNCSDFDHTGSTIEIPAAA